MKKTIVGPVETTRYWVGVRFKGEIDTIPDNEEGMSKTDAMMKRDLLIKENEQLTVDNVYVVAVYGVFPLITQDSAPQVEIK